MGDWIHAGIVTILVTILRHVIVEQFPNKEINDDNNASIAIFHEQGWTKRKLE